MKALLVVAHGSRRDESNNEVHRLTAQLRELAASQYAQVHCAFLELAEPLIPEGVAQCIAQGADEVVVLPYFLSAGRHVSQDIPQEVAKAQAAHPAAIIRLAPYLGMADSLLPVMLQLANQ